MRDIDRWTCKAQDARDCARDILAIVQEARQTQENFCTAMGLVGLPQTESERNTLQARYSVWYRAVCLWQ